MTPTQLRLDIVSAEQEIFSAHVNMVLVTGELGELGIMPGHTPLVTSLKPGNVRAVLSSQAEEIFYFNGGMLEVQPSVVTILADTAMRARDLDEAAALAAKERAEKALADKHSDIDFARASADLAEALAQIRTIQKLKRYTK